MSTEKPAGLQKLIFIEPGIVLRGHGNNDVSHYLFVFKAKITIPDLISEHLIVFSCHSIYILQDYLINVKHFLYKNADNQQIPPITIITA